MVFQKKRDMSLMADWAYLTEDRAQNLFLTVGAGFSLR